MAYNVLVKTISGGIQQFRASDAVDIAIITVLIYHLILLTKETRAFQVLKGIGIVFIAALVSDVLQLVTISWLLNSLLSVGIYWLWYCSSRSFAVHWSILAAAICSRASFSAA